MSEDWSSDPFVDPDDPEARERAQRRAEREEKRKQKEAKEAAKKAKSAPPPVPEPAAEPPKPPRTPEEEFWDEEPTRPEPSAPAASEPVPPAEAVPPREPVPPSDPEPAAPVTPPAPARPPEPTPSTEAARPVDEAAAVSASAAAAAAAGQGASEPPPAPAEPTTDDWTSEAPREDWGFEDDGLHDEGDPAMAGAASRDGDGGRGRGGFLGALRRHPFRIIAVIFALIVVWFLYSLFQPFHGDGSGKVALTIPKGSSVSEVGDLLGEKDVIDSSTLFQIRVTLEGKRSDLYAGHFTLAHGMSYGAAIDALSEAAA